MEEDDDEDIVDEEDPKDLSRASPDSLVRVEDLKLVPDAVGLSFLGLSSVCSHLAGKSLWIQSDGPDTPKFPVNSELVRPSSRASNASTGSVLEFADSRRRISYFAVYDGHGGHLAAE